jgi:hypothetical protein
MGNNSREAEGPSQSERGATKIERRSSFSQTVDMQEQEKKVFFEKILPSLNQKLEGEQYFGKVLSIADVQYYSEISTILLLSSREISKSDLPALH